MIFYGDGNEMPSSVESVMRLDLLWAELASGHVSRFSNDIAMRHKHTFVSANASFFVHLCIPCMDVTSLSLVVLQNRSR